MNGWGRIIAPQNGGSTNYIFPLKLGVLQWSRHLFNYWKNKKTIIEKNSSFYLYEIEFALIIGKLHGFGPRYNLR